MCKHFLKAATSQVIYSWLILLTFKENKLSFYFHRHNWVGKRSLVKYYRRRLPPITFAFRASDISWHRPCCTAYLVGTNSILSQHYWRGLRFDIFCYKLTSDHIFESSSEFQVVPSSALIETLNDIFDQCHHTFLTSLESHVHRILERIQPPSQDLSPSLGVNQLLNLLRDVLSGGHIVDAQASDVADVQIFNF